MADYTLQYPTEIQNGASYKVKAEHLTGNFNALKSDIDDQLDRITTSPQTVAGAITFSSALTIITPSSSMNPATKAYVDERVFSPGTIKIWAGSSAETGWLLCYGQAISRTTYADLFAVISTTYGVGDGSTTFNIPDLRGYVIIGKDNMGGSAASRITSSSTNGGNSTTLGGVGGDQTHTLSTSEMPAHAHDMRVSANGGSGATATNYVGSNSDWNASYTTTNTVIVQNTGGGGAHSNTQPWMALNIEIKY
jgi:Microcystin-dependent protein